MLTIAKLFGKSPFAPLQTHMSKVADCIGQLPILFKALSEQDERALSKVVHTLSALENEANLTKADIRTHLPKSLFFPVDRTSLLEILACQDELADQAKAIAHSISLYPLPLFDEFQEDFSLFCQKNIEAVYFARELVKELDELLECSFGGIEAEKVRGMTLYMTQFEDEIDHLKHQLKQKVYQVGERMQLPAFHLWLTVIDQISLLVHLAEKLSNRVRMLLELQ